MARRRSAGGRSPTMPPADPLAERDPHADPESVARTICLRLLTIRARTRSELADALTARQVPAPASTRVLDRLAEVGLIDDRAFAESFVTSRQHDRGLAAREISRQLRDKGVDESVVEDAVLKVDAELEHRTAQRMVERKLASMSRLDPAVQTRRLVEMLARKGYSPAMAFQVVREVLRSPGAQPSDDEPAWLA